MICTGTTLAKPFQGFKPTDYWWLIVIATLLLVLTYPMSLLAALLAMVAFQLQRTWVMVNRLVVISPGT